MLMKKSMVQSRLKYARKSRYQKQIFQFVRDLNDGDISHYHIKKLVWHDVWSVRIGNLRILLKKKNDQLEVWEIQERWDIYDFLKR